MRADIDRGQRVVGTFRYSVDETLRHGMQEIEREMQALVQSDDGADGRQGERGQERPRYTKLFDIGQGCIEADDIGS